VVPFLEDGTVVLLGGATGVDTLALRWLAAWEQVRVVVVVPGRLRDQPADAQAAVRVAPRTTVTELAAAGLDTAAHHARNRHMVDRVDLVIAFPRNDEPEGGTWHTIAYARAHQVPHLVVPV
jgi:predicted Rossmann-fold nucleotide-binding protein